jgi:hypothetical protein
MPSEIILTPTAIRWSSAANASIFVLARGSS